MSFSTQHQRLSHCDRLYGFVFIFDNTFTLLIKKYTQQSAGPHIWLKVTKHYNYAQTCSRFFRFCHINEWTTDILFYSSKKSRSQSIIFPKRSVLKNGQCNVLKKSSNSNRRIRYLQDIFTTLVDVKWRWTLVVFALSFIMSWLFYAGIYWLIAYAHGDFEHLEVSTSSLRAPVCSM